MKARTEPNSEITYNDSPFDKFASSSAALKCALNGDSNRGDLSSDANTRLNNDVSPRKSSPDPHDVNLTSDDTPHEKGLYPLHFNTSEALEYTPPILKSLTSGGRGPDTFVYPSSRKPASLPWNEDDPCKTFVITTDKREFPGKKISSDEAPPVNGFDKFHVVEKNGYPSYVIEKSESENMNGESSGENLKSVPNSEKTDVNAEVETVSVKDRQVSEVNENCDKKVLCGSSKNSSDTVVLSFDPKITGKKEQTFARLQDELEKAHQELKLKDEEVARLTRIREDVERELEELTASLFQEAHKMVSKAKEEQAAAEKALKESQMKVDVLTAEVVALKTLVLTSTPSRPNPHLHPQIGKEENSGGVNLFNKKHRRSPSHFNLKYGRENSPPESPVRDDRNPVQNTVTTAVESKDISEVDPTIHKEFMNWTLTCRLDKTDPFIDRIYREDINLCLDFSNRELAEKVQNAIETRNIFIEAVTDKSKTIFPRKCALLEVTRQCHYRMKLGDEDIWYNISQMCRNRIIAVCDFINYLRYIELGLVKSSVHDMYWEIMRFRKEMVLARLGLSQPPSSEMCLFELAKDLKKKPAGEMAIEEIRTKITKMQISVKSWICCFH